MSTPAAPRYDCIVVGGGHNGLTCAAYLARAGRSVLVLEASARLGGAAVTREFAPGFRVSACAHLLHAPRTVLEELGLAAHGLKLAPGTLPTLALGDDAHLLLGEPATWPAHAARDAERYAPYHTRLARLAAALRPLLSTPPPGPGTPSWRERAVLGGLTLRLRALGRRDLRELLRIGGMCVADLLDEHFQSSAVKGALAFDAVLGANFGPRSPGTVFTLLYRMAASGGAGLAQPLGGLGALSEALAAAARAAGAEVRLGAPVRSILVHDDRAAGVVLDITELGAAYLGGTSLGALAAAGLVTEGRPGAVRQLSAALSWDLAPWCPVNF